MDVPEVIALLPLGILPVHADADADADTGAGAGAVAGTELIQELVALDPLGTDADAVGGIMPLDTLDK